MGVDLGGLMVVERETVHGTFDAELDLLPQRPTRRSRERIERYQRLIANPLLAVLGWVLLFPLLRFALRTRDLTGVIVWVTQLFSCLLLMQYHCLDCGKTGWLPTFRRHACAAVIARWQNGEPRGLRGPGIKVQMIAWLIMLSLSLVLVLILWRRPS
jgi:hypothetical protein